MSTDTIGPLLRQVEELIEQYVVLPSDHARTALALFAAHTWAIEAAHATPYLIVLSAEKQSGKSRLVEVLKFVTRHPYHTASGSEAAIFQIIGLKKPTLFLDETDAIFGVRSDRTEGLRGVLNAGNRPGAVALRGGKDGQPHEYPTFCPKVLTGIDTGKLPDTIVDRGIVIRMRRRAPSDSLSRFREHKVEAETQVLRDALAAWAENAVPVLRDAEPDLPAELPDRAADSWEPLLAIADMAGGEWPERARHAALALNGPTEDDEPTSTGALLLSAAYRAFGDATKISSTDLRERINADEDSPFHRWNDGLGLDALKLSELLRPYEIRTKAIRFEDRTLKGYTRAMFRDAWTRYIGIDPKQGKEQETEIPDKYRDVPTVSTISTFVHKTTDEVSNGSNASHRDNLETPETPETDCPF